MFKFDINLKFSLILIFAICCACFGFTPSKYTNLDLTTGANNGSSISDAWQSMSAMVSGMAAGDDIAITGSETMAALVNMTTTVGTSTNPIRIWAYDATLTNREKGGAVIDGSTVNAFLNFVSASVIEINGWEIKNGGAIQINNSASDGPTFVDCYMHDGSKCVVGSNELMNFIGCTFQDFTGDVLENLAVGSMVQKCLFDGIGGNCITGNNLKQVSKCVFNDITGSAITSGASSIDIEDCIFNLVTASGVKLTGAFTQTARPFIYRCKFTNGGAYGIESSGTCVVQGDQNSFYSNTSGQTSIAGTYLGGDNDITLSDDYYTNVDSLDFTPTCDEDQISYMVGYAGYNESFTNIGAVTYADSVCASGGGPGDTVFVEGAGDCGNRVFRRRSFR